MLYDVIHWPTYFFTLPCGSNGSQCIAAVQLQITPLERERDDEQIMYTHFFLVFIFFKLFDIKIFILKIKLLF